MQPYETTESSKNRSSLIFIAGLLAASIFAISADGWTRLILGANRSQHQNLTEATVSPVGPRELRETDRSAAAVAWRYFEYNTQPETGLVDSVAGFPSATLWDQGSYVFALSAAHRLDLIDDADFTSRVERFLSSLAKLPLYEGILPNKAYNTRTLQMVDYKNATSQDGVGWSALDVARLLAGFRVLERLHPEFGPNIRGILSQWQLGAMVQKGELIGASREGGATVYSQEGRIGYEQYAARAAALWGLDVIRAISADRIIRWETVSRVQVPVDLRNHGTFRAITPTLSEPYFLQGLELGLDSEATYMAAQIYLAQEARFERQNVPTMVSEDHINQAPYFLYSSVHSNGKPWAVVSEDGSFYNNLRSLSTKAVFAWDALYGRAYTQSLRESLTGLERHNGWAAGIYESDKAVNDVVTLNTNAVVLESVHYMALGPLWQIK
ncbi:DUF3131 domain-containing protein [Roseobacter sp. N2S]|uniref:DUF3131 domain-containing protein n=1 Tax=Roseobacter sp. N2S TaxID=2663844 RepID=UPI0028548F84|nr:DUF3131 domain-containing protein [Roseobacter sp. N2S]MDR6263030.1 hypothetical protein [Roseobacter sp. N2S]